MVTMPETAVKEYGPSFFHKNHVGFSRQFGVMYAITTITHAVNQPPESQFRLGVLAPNLVHMQISLGHNDMNPYGSRLEGLRRIPRAHRSSPMSKSPINTCIRTTTITPKRFSYRDDSRQRAATKYSISQLFGRVSPNRSICSWVAFDFAAARSSLSPELCTLRMTPQAFTPANE